MIFSLNKSSVFKTERVKTFRCDVKYIISGMPRFKEFSDHENLRHTLCYRISLLNKVKFRALNLDIAFYLKNTVITTGKFSKTWKPFTSCHVTAVSLWQTCCTSKFLVCQ